MMNLGKTRNAQRILTDLSEYVSYFTDERKKVFYLNAQGRDRVQAEKARKKTSSVTHYLMRNDLYINVGRPSTWENEVKIGIPDTKVSIVADAAFIANKIHQFVEVDYKQSMSKNVEKIRRYKQLAAWNPNFQLIWVTTTPYRKKKIESLCSELKVKVHLWDDIK
jgi:hypothetical protein